MASGIDVALLELLLARFINYWLTYSIWLDFRLNKHEYEQNYNQNINMTKLRTFKQPFSQCIGSQI